MYPYLELFGTKFYMTGIWIVIACIVFLITVYVLCKKYHQDYVKFFNRLPWLLISIYFVGLYVSFLLEGNGIIPTSISAFSPYWYKFSLIWIVIACFVSMVCFLRQFKRNETKKVWIDILFFWFINAIIVLWVFLLLWDNFIGKQYWWIFHVTALMSDSALVKYWWVYPLWIFLSLWALAINLIITLRKISAKKSWKWLWWFILLFMLFICILPFWNYPAHWVIQLFWKISLDLNYYVFFFLIIYCLIRQNNLKKVY